MELLIPGLLLVALMVWASTRIKKNAAAAFDAETVDTEKFAIRKPEGFLHVLNDDSGLAFRSYSKEFGKVGDKDVRRATIEIEKHPNTAIEALRTKFETSPEEIESFEAYKDAGEKAAWMFSKRVVDGGEYRVIRRLVTRGGTIWEVRGAVLTDHQDDASDKIEAALESVQLK